MHCSSSKIRASLDEYVDGALDRIDAARVEAHVASCPDCASLLAELRVVDALLLAPRILEPAPNFTFAVMAEVRVLPVPHPRHRFSFASIGAYVVFAWLAIGAFLLFGGHAARAALATLGLAGAAEARGTSALAGAVAHVFGSHTIDITAAMGALLGFDLLAAVVAIFAFNALRARRGRAPLTLVVALLASFFCVTSAASAHTYTRGLNVWSDGVTLTEDDEVTGDVNVIFGTLSCDGPATIDGNVTIFFGTFDPTDQCDVRGTTSSVFGPAGLEGFVPGAASDGPYRQNRALVRKLGWDLVVLIAFLLFPFRMRVALDRVEKHPGSSTLVGAIALVAMIPIAVLLLVSIIGIPLIPIEIAAVFAAAWIGQGAVALLLGRRLFELTRPQTTPAPLAALAIGLALITAAEMLPIIGWAVTALVVLAGLGAAILAFVRETAFHTIGTRGPGARGDVVNRSA